MSYRHYLMCIDRCHSYLYRSLISIAASPFVYKIFEGRLSSDKRLK